MFSSAKRLKTNKNENDDIIWHGFSRFAWPAHLLLSVDGTACRFTLVRRMHVADCPPSAGHRQHQSSTSQTFQFQSKLARWFQILCRLPFHLEFVCAFRFPRDSTTWWCRRWERAGARLVSYCGSHSYCRTVLVRCAPLPVGRRDGARARSKNRMPNHIKFYHVLSIYKYN